MIGQLVALDMLVGRNIADAGWVTTISPGSLYEVKASKDPSYHMKYCIHKKQAGCADVQPPNMISNVGFASILLHVSYY